MLFKTWLNWRMSLVVAVEQAGFGGYSADLVIYPPCQGYHISAVEQQALFRHKKMNMGYDQA